MQIKTKTNLYIAVALGAIKPKETKNKRWSQILEHG